MALHLFDVPDTTPRVSPATLSDRLHGLAKEAERAGLDQAAAQIAILAVSLPAVGHPVAMAA